MKILCNVIKALKLLALESLAVILIYQIVYQPLCGIKYNEFRDISKEILLDTTGYSIRSYENQDFDIAYDNGCVYIQSYEKILPIVATMSDGEVILRHGTREKAIECLILAVSMLVCGNVLLIVIKEVH